MEAPKGTAKQKLNNARKQSTDNASSVQNDTYQIVVHTEPDEEMAAEGTPYFWCVLKWGNQGWHNVRCGWAKTRLGGFKDAEWQYELLVGDK